MATKNLTFHWQQTLPDPNDLAAFKLYKSETQGGPYELFETVPYVDPQQEYSAQKDIESPDGQVKTWYFVLTAIDQADNESGYSNEASITIDFESPAVPFSLTVVVTSV